MVLVGAMIKLIHFQLSVFEKILDDERRINILSIVISSLSRSESIIFLVWSWYEKNQTCVFTTLGTGLF